jgi:hypothetical protein
MDKQREKLIELLCGKSIDTIADVEYVADCILADGWIRSPCKVMEDFGKTVFLSREDAEKALNGVE